MFLKHYSAFFCLILFIVSSSYSQVIENIRARTEGDKIIIEYDLRDAPSDSWLEVKVYGSHDSFSAPLTNATGAVGKVTPGQDNQIEWLYGHELDNFNGDLSFQIEAEVIFHLSFITPKQSIRRGKNNVVSWRGGRPQDSIQCELITKDKKVIWNASALNKTGKLEIKLSRDVVLGKGYQLQLTTRDENLVLPMRVQRKVSRFWIVSPIVVALGVAGYLLRSVPKELPGAPPPPNGN